MLTHLAKVDSLKSMYLWGYHMHSVWTIRGGGKISEVGVFQVIWKLSYIETSVPKDFSQKSVFWKRILGPKNDKKLISLKVKEIQKSWRSWTPNIFQFERGSYFFNFFQFLFLSEICVFGLFRKSQFSRKILSFVKNPFAWKFLYIKAFIWPGKPLPPRFCHHL